MILDSSHTMNLDISSNNKQKKGNSKTNKLQSRNLNTIHPCELSALTCRPLLMLIEQIRTEFITTHLQKVHSATAFDTTEDSTRRDIFALFSVGNSPIFRNWKSFPRI